MRHTHLFIAFLGVAIALVACGGGQASVVGEEEESAVTSSFDEVEEAAIDGIPARRVVFSIGQRDDSYDEFTARESLNPPQYECTVGVDCFTETFPVGMSWSEDHAHIYPFVAEEDVESITIHFTLAGDHTNLTLRVSRAGDETLLITLDDRDPIPVTAAMLGSGDSWQPGTFDVNLGSVTEGSHTLLFTVHPTDGDGFPYFAWDALLLFTGLP